MDSRTPPTGRSASSISVSASLISWYPMNSFHMRRGAPFKFCKACRDAEQALEERHPAVDSLLCRLDELIDTAPSVDCQRGE